MIGRLILSTRNMYKITLPNGKQSNARKCNIISENKQSFLLKTKEEFATRDLYIKLSKDLDYTVLGQVGNKRDDLNIFHNLYTNNWLNKFKTKQLWNNVNIKELVMNREIYNKPVITIDPKGAIDLDDGFTFEQDDNNYYLDIHIADPTYLFDDVNNIQDIFKELYKRCGTCYVPKRDENDNVSILHLLPRDLVDDITLIQNTIYKRAITFKFKICKTTKQIEFNYSKTYLTNIINFTYEDYDKQLDINTKNDLIDISNILIDVMNVRLDKLNNDMPSISHEFIQVFMIWTNYYVGNYLVSNNKICILRTQNTKEEIPLDIPQYAKTFLNYSANYEINKENTNNYFHNSLNINNYAHISSPMRRVVDMINHLSLFDYNNLDELINILDINEFNNNLKRYKKISNAYELVNYLNNVKKEFIACVMDIKQYEKRTNLLLVVYNEHDDFKKMINVELPMILNIKLKKYDEIKVNIYYNSYNYSSTSFPFSITIL